MALVAATYGLYTLTRNALPDSHATARANARELYDLEQRLHVDGEHWLNTALAGPHLHALAVAANYVYSISHLLVTLSVLIWLYVRRPRRYAAARTVLLLTTLSGLIGYWLYPLAPPRFFPHLGFVDTVVRDSTWGGWGSSAMASMSNQYAAMPSMHVAWSIWVAGVVVLSLRSTVVRVAAIAYPMLIGVVVVATGNHWLLDAAGAIGALTLALLTYAVLRRLPRRRTTSERAAGDRGGERRPQLREHPRVEVGSLRRQTGVRREAVGADHHELAAHDGGPRVDELVDVSVPDEREPPVRTGVPRDILVLDHGATERRAHAAAGSAVDAKAVERLRGDSVQSLHTGGGRHTAKQIDRLRRVAQQLEPSDDGAGARDAAKSGAAATRTRSHGEVGGELVPGGRRPVEGTGTHGRHRRSG